MTGSFGEGNFLGGTQVHVGLLEAKTLRMPKPSFDDPGWVLERVRIWQWRLAMMNPTDITIPESMEELDALCERWRSAMSKRFDFGIGPKKQNKLRDAVSQFLGFPNGFQQLKASFPEDLSKTFPYPDHWPDVIIFQEDMGDITLHLNAEDMTPNRQGDIKEIETPEASAFLTELPFMEDGHPVEEELTNSLLGMSTEEADSTLKAYYQCERVIVKHPNVDEYGVSGIASHENLVKKIKAYYSLECDPYIEDDHHLIDMGDDSCAKVYLKLVKKPKPTK